MLDGGLALLGVVNLGGGSAERLADERTVFSPLGVWFVRGLNRPAFHPSGSFARKGVFLVPASRRIRGQLSSPVIAGVKQGSVDRPARGPYIIQAHSYATDGKRNCCGEKEPTSHLGEAIPTEQRKE